MMANHCRAKQAGWVLMSVLLLLLLVAAPLTFLLQDWYYLTQQQALSVEQWQQSLDQQSVQQVVNKWQLLDDDGE